MNLVCYPHYTGGGVVCNILNKTPETRSKVGTTVNNMEHGLFIGDNWSIYDEYPVTEFDKKYQKVLRRGFDATWLSTRFLGTHCHPVLLDTSKFSNTISITTESTQSKLYRWLRAYNLFFKPQWLEYSGMERVDLLRETAKSYIAPFYRCKHKDIHHLEFCDIAHNSTKFINLCHTLVDNPEIARLDKWIELNKFMFERNTAEYDSFMQADYELSTEQHYDYT